MGFIDNSLNAMKVLHIIDSGGLYGAEVMLLNLVHEQIKMGLEPTICSIGEKGVLEKPIEAEAVKRGFKVTRFRMMAGPNIFGAFKILRYAKREKFDILHSHGYKGNILFGFIPKAMRRLPLITTVHGWTSTTSSSFSKMKLYEWLDVRSLRHMDRVILVNKGMLSNPRLKVANLQNLTVINNGIPPIKRINPKFPLSQGEGLGEGGNGEVFEFKQNSLSNTLDKDIVNFCKEGFVVGAIGRLSYEKGFNYLIEAVAGLAGEIPNIKLVIIGEGGERGFLEKMVSDLGLQGKVLMPGYRDAAHRYLPLFKIFVMPSLTEGLPITLLEAMQYEVPIVATGVGGIPALLEGGSAGVLVNPGDTAGLVEALGLLKRDSKLAVRLSKRDKEAVMLKYSSRKMAAEYLEIYKSIERRA